MAKEDTTKMYKQTYVQKQSRMFSGIRCLSARVKGCLTEQYRLKEVLKNEKDSPI